MGTITNDDDLPILGAVVVAVLVQVGQWVLISLYSKSVGKFAVKTRIQRLDGSAPGFLHGVVLREWALGAVILIPYLGSLISLINALFIFGEARRCLHDQIAGTVVVDDSMPLATWDAQSAAERFR